MSTIKDTSSLREEIRDAFESETRTRQYKGTGNWTDSRSIRQEFGLPPFWRGLYESTDADRVDADSGLVKFPDVVPDALIHLKRHERDLLKREDPDLSQYNAPRRKVLQWLAVDEQSLMDMSIGGTDYLATGEPGSGKTTMALSWCRLRMEVNNEAVIWRGTPSRAEWLPFAPWTTLLLPSGFDPIVRVQPPGPEHEPFTMDVADLVREVNYYRGPRDIIKNHLNRGQFHVVYPDPSFHGVEDVFAESARTPNFEYVSPWEAEPDEHPTPLNHWWFAFVVARVDMAPPMPLALSIDEIGDLVPQEARADDHDTYAKVVAFQDATVDARKTDLSLFFYGHNEADVHEKIRRKLRWRITMNGWPNPTEGDKVVGFNSAPMENQITQYMGIGEALMWTATHYWTVSWQDIPKPTPARITIEFPSLSEVSPHA